MRERWPHWIYRDSKEPDYRFSFANERTFLAWIRTALAFLAGGVALDAVNVGLPGLVQGALAVLLVLLGLACAVVSWPRWGWAERAMRNDGPLPTSAFSVFLTAAVVLAAVGILVVWTLQ